MQNTVYTVLKSSTIQGNRRYTFKHTRNICIHICIHAYLEI